MRIVSAVGATAVSAVLFGVAFPPTQFRTLAWVALAPLLVVLQRVSLRHALLLTWLWSVLMAYVVGDWFPRAIATYYQQPWAVGIAFFFGISSTMAAGYYMAFAGIYRVLARTTVVWLPLLAAAAWVTAELGRGRLFTGSAFFIGNPWALLGYSQVGVPTTVQIADVTGVYGISFILVSVNAALAEVWISRHELPGAWRRACACLALAAVPAIAALGYGSLVLRGKPWEGSETPPARIAIVQGNLSIGSRWHPSFYGRNLDVYLKLTHEVLSSDDPSVVFWPEAAMTFFLEEEPDYQRAIGRVLFSTGAQLVAGGPSIAEREPLRFFNSVFVMSPSGEPMARYDKEYLVPFSEYFPFGKIDVMRRRFGRIRVFSPGAPDAAFPTKAGPAGILICNEAMLPEVAAKRVDQGAEYLLNPSNDTWIPDAKFTAQQFDIISLRAVEQRRYLVRASTAGPSGIVDPWGRVLIRTEPGTRDTIVGSIRGRTEETVYGRVGDSFAFLCAAIIGVTIVAGRRRARRGVQREPRSAAGSKPATM